MLSYAHIATLLCSVMPLIDASAVRTVLPGTGQLTHGVSHISRGNPSLSTKAALLRVKSDVLARRDDEDPEGTSVSVSVHAPQVILKIWADLNLAADQCRSAFQQQAPLQVAIEVASSLSVQVNKVNNQASQCACNNDPAAADVSVQLKAIVPPLLLSLQAVIQIGPQKYADAWDAQLKPIFHDCSKVFISLKKISLELNIDLEAIVKQLHLDLNVFLSVGIDLNSLLGLHVELLGLISL
ncbi:hypothetical protein PGT21_030834 [Puccinia graminis f. sp. tritici]|uniref:Uncharacterized protein n=1 Tax=Puccinia graminis f. sp. tritici TaxID=56615 RepID=A0A5B0MSJ1_PUCGR|nr:hypothetical protein PGTUg99_016178 [Puccinia graminis f. sp. tritici]KAA1094818.1 hypothetical protein PGT21_030834 [Puccinia graminis f. sp. tritici]